MITENNPCGSILVLACLLAGSGMVVRAAAFEVFDQRGLLAETLSLCSDLALLGAAIALLVAAGLYVVHKFIRLW